MVSLFLCPRGDAMQPDSNRFLPCKKLFSQESNQTLRFDLLSYDSFAGRLHFTVCF